MRYSMLQLLKQSLVSSYFWLFTQNNLPSLDWKCKNSEEKMIKKIFPENILLSLV